MKKIGFFDEDEGVRSSIRLQMFLTLIFAFIVIGYQVYKNQVDYLLALTLLVGAFAPKVLQKFAEIKELKDVKR
jgi:hypothetical membrane protein